MSAKRVVKSQKREKIILSAMKVFAKKGIKNTTVNDIAVEAGIGKGTIYEYFRDKNDIIINSFKYFVNLFDSGIEDIALDDSVGKEKLLKITSFVINYLREEQNEIMNLTFDFWAESIRAKTVKDIIYREMKDFYRSYRKLISDMIKQGKMDGSFSNKIDEKSLASLLVGMLDGLMVQWILDRDEINLFKVEQEMKRIINMDIN